MRALMEEHTHGGNLSIFDRALGRATLGRATLGRTTLGRASEGAGVHYPPPGTTRPDS